MHRHVGRGGMYQIMEGALFYKLWFCSLLWLCVYQQIQT